MSTSGDEKERKDAAKVMKLLGRGRHWVLVVLLLSNVVVNESLPIFLDSVIGGGVGAVVLSTTLIVIFGEIIPQCRYSSSCRTRLYADSVLFPAVCARYGLSIGAKAAPFVLALMYLEFPIAYPIAKLLDHLLGEEEGVTYKKAELKTFVGLHRRAPCLFLPPRPLGLMRSYRAEFGEETLNEDEVTIISSVLELGDKSVQDIMTPLEGALPPLRCSRLPSDALRRTDIYALPTDTRLSHAVVDQILASGHSRIPVHEPGNTTDFVGMLSTSTSPFLASVERG